MAAGLVLVDLVDIWKRSAPADAGGVADVAFDAVEAGYVWRVGLIQISTNSALGTVALTYVGDISDQYLRSGSIHGNQDTYDAAWPVIVPATRQLRIQWRGCTPGAIGLAAIQYELYQQSTAALNPVPLTQSP